MWYKTRKAGIKMSERTKVKVLRVLWYSILVAIWYCNWLFAPLNFVVWMITFIIGCIMGGITLWINKGDEDDEV